MNITQSVVIVLVGLFLFANLLHPGGWILTLLIVAVIIALYALLEFVPEYLLVTNQGKNARKNNRRQRRASGLNPFSRNSSREGDARDSSTQTNQTGGNDE
ncbi:hypothetical protein [Natronorubrum texcoconense]|uniref:DUF2892 domain-containing protein n=1 Tax=Natronorubrum texcoconense TaxID=1095776 RepID=A0A1G9H816_9EURY|nr:hypothetical protein [Natronorubrum texcoconense]SDL09002.1 hypothetical protein SAMN04515672_0138 [Natronorubrum texcoconense]